MYHNSVYIKKCWALAPISFELPHIWPTAAILDFEIQVVSLDSSFSMVLRKFFTKGDLCIMI